MKSTIRLFELRKMVLLAVAILTMMVFSTGNADAFNSFSYTEHGIAAQIQEPQNTVAIQRFGWGTVITGKPNTGTWVQIPLSGHGYVGGGNIPTIYAIRVKFNSEFGYPVVRSIHLREDQDIMRIYLNGQTLYGNYLNGAYIYQFAKFNPMNPMNVSLYVDFGPAVNGQNPRIQILGVTLYGDLD